MLADLLIPWTIRLSMACYAIFLWLSLSRTSPWKTLRIWWTGGLIFMIAHFVVAFQFVHHWSNSHAVEDTARQTQQLLGWEFGEGIYFSYLFLAIWTVDVAWWWLKPTQYANRAVWLSSTVHVYVLFIAVNGCIVFEAGAVRWAALLVGAVLIVRLAATRRRPKLKPST